MEYNDINTNKCNTNTCNKEYNNSARINISSKYLSDFLPSTKDYDKDFA